LKKIYINNDCYKIGNKEIRFLTKAYGAMILSDKIIVELDNIELRNNYPNLDYWRTLFAYDFEGNILWQVENPWYINRNSGERIEYDPKDEKRFPGGDSVGSIMYNPRLDMIVAWGRVGYQLDTDTGKLLKIVSRER
jgi:hypothetical protein